MELIPFFVPPSSRVTDWSLIRARPPREGTNDGSLDRVRPAGHPRLLGLGNVCYPALCTVAIPCWPFAVACSTEAFKFLVPSPNFYICPGVICHCSLSDHVHRGDPGTRNITMQPNGVDTVSFSSCCDVAHHEQVGEFVERDFKLQDQPRDRFFAQPFQR